MDIFNLNINNPDENDKYLDSWFAFMNYQFEKIEEANHEMKINNILIDNDIDTI